MKNNTNITNILKDIDNSAFLNKLKFNLENNLTYQLIESLSNILAIDYFHRLKQEPTIDSYSKKCVDRLVNHLKHMIFTEEGFSGVMTLFLIAITEEKTDNDELINIQEKNQDIIVDNVMASEFSDLSPDEQLNLKDVLKSLITNLGGKEIMNFIHSNPKLFCSLVFSAHRAKKEKKEILEMVAVNLNKIISTNKSINRKKNNIKLLTGKITMAAGLVAVASAATFLGGAIFATTIIPVIAISIKLGTVIGEKLGENIAQNNSFIKKKQSIIKDFEVSIRSTSLDQNIAQSKYIQQKKEITIQPELIEIKSKVKDILNQNNVQDKTKKNSRHR